MNYITLAARLILNSLFLVCSSVIFLVEFYLHFINACCLFMVFVDLSIGRSVSFCCIVRLEIFMNVAVKKQLMSVSRLSPDDEECSISEEYVTHVLSS